MSGPFVAFERGLILVTHVQPRSKEPAQSVCLSGLSGLSGSTKHTRQTEQTRQTVRYRYDHGNYLPPASPSKSPKLGIPSSEGIGIDLYSVYLVPCPRREGEQTAKKTISVCENFDGPHVRHNGKTLAQDAQKDRPARPQRAKRRGVRFGTLSF
jgi:hypothetical protein